MTLAKTVRSGWKPVTPITLLYTPHCLVPHFGDWTAGSPCGGAEMFECLLLMHRAGARWVPLVAIPGGIAGWVAAICLMLSGIKGIIAARGANGNTDLVANPARDVKWITTQPQPTAQGRSSRRQILIVLPPPLP